MNKGDTSAGDAPDSVVLGLDAKRAAASQDRGVPERGVSERRVLRVAIGVQHGPVRLRCEVYVPPEIEEAFRDALAAGRGRLTVRVETVDTVELPRPAVTAAERLEMNRRLSRLSPAERNVLDLLADGLTNSQIAERLFLAHKTVKNYVSRLLCKLGMSRRTEAAVFAARMRDAAWSDSFGVVGMDTFGDDGDITLTAPAATGPA